MRGQRIVFVLGCLVLIGFALAPSVRSEDAEPLDTPDPVAGEPGRAELDRLEADRSLYGFGSGGSPVMAGWDKEEGFFLADTNKENFLLTIGGLFQGRAVYKARDPRGNVPAEHDQLSFTIPRARLELGGYVLDPNMTFRLEIDDNTLDEVGGMSLLDAYVLYKAGEYFGDNPGILAFGAGQFKPYFLRQELVHAGSLQMVDRSLTNEFFNIGRNIGVWVQSDLNPVFLSFAVTNGWTSANETPRNVDQVPSFIGKVDFSILGHEAGKYVESNVSGSEDPQWTIGASFATDYDNGTSESGSVQNYAAYQFGIDTAFKWGPFSLQAEYIGRWLNYPVDNTIVPGDGSTHYAHGLYVQGGVFLVPGTLEVTGRVSTIWGVDGPRDGNGVEAGPGINWYLSGDHRVKLQTDLMFFDISGNLPVASDRLGADGLPGPGEDPFLSFFSPYAGLRTGEQGAMWRIQLQLDF